MPGARDAHRRGVPSGRSPGAGRTIHSRRTGVPAHDVTSARLAGSRRRRMRSTSSATASIVTVSILAISPVVRPSVSRSAISRWRGVSVESAGWPMVGLSRVMLTGAREPAGRADCSGRTGRPPDGSGECWREAAVSSSAGVRWGVTAHPRTTFACIVASARESTEGALSGAPSVSPVRRTMSGTRSPAGLSAVPAPPTTPRVTATPWSGIRPARRPC